MNKTTPARLYKTGKSCNIQCLHGFYDVKILEGPFLLLPTFSWFKQICHYTMSIGPEASKSQKKVMHYGYNYINGVKQGYFNLKQKRSYLLVDYMLSSNLNTMWFETRDHLRVTIAPHGYIGKIFMKVFGLYIPFGYFSLTYNSEEINKRFPASSK